MHHTLRKTSRNPKPHFWTRFYSIIAFNMAHIVNESPSKDQLLKTFIGQQILIHDLKLSSFMAELTNLYKLPCPCIALICFKGSLRNKRGGHCCFLGCML